MSMLSSLIGVDIKLDGTRLVRFKVGDKAQTAFLHALIDIMGQVGVPDAQINAIVSGIKRKFGWA